MFFDYLLQKFWCADPHAVRSPSDLRMEFNRDPAAYVLHFHLRSLLSFCYTHHTPKMHTKLFTIPNKHRLPDHCITKQNIDVSILSKTSTTSFTSHPPSQTGNPASAPEFHLLLPAPGSQTQNAYSGVLPGLPGGSSPPFFHCPQTVRLPENRKAFFCVH